MKLSQIQILENKKRAISLLQSVNRPGMDKLIDWLENKSDYFKAPASTAFHGAYEGGLCEHSLQVYDAMVALLAAQRPLANEKAGLDQITNEMLVITALMHDICKVNNYETETRNAKDPVTGQWYSYYQYKVTDRFPVGHGEKSVIMLQNFIRLTADEILAIRWHMGASDPATFLSPYTKNAYADAMNNCALLIIMEQADISSSFLSQSLCDPKTENRI